jgi:NAD(P)-dependent dehydrogenase (short-subunit alcohol dehydrogenase family)
MRATFETNVFGVVSVNRAALPLLREAPATDLNGYTGTRTVEEGARVVVATR